MMNISFSSWRRFFGYIKRHYSMVFTASISSVLYNFFDMMPEVIMGVAIDVVVTKNNYFFVYMGVEDVKIQLCILGVLAFAVWCFESLFEYMSEIGWKRIAYAIQHALRVDVYRHVQALEISFFEEKNTGELVTILNDDINQLEQFFDKGVADFIYFFTNICMVGIIFFYSISMISLFIAIPIGIIIGIAYFFQNRLGILYAQVRQCMSIMVSSITNTIMGIVTIKSYVTEEYELTKMRSDSAAYKLSNEEAVLFGAALVPIIRLTIGLVFVVVIIVGGWCVVNGVVTVGTYTILISMTQRVLWPCMYLARITDIFKRTAVCIERVCALLDRPVGIVDGTYEQLKQNTRGLIEFKNVSFSYGNGVDLFDNLSFTIQSGQTVGVVGATGSGKSSLVKLLLRLYDPVSGSIMLDGIPINHFTLSSYRRLFGIVSQDIFLFTGTVSDNIAYGSPEATEGDIINAAKMAHIHDFVMSLPHGYDTFIGERGQKLSGGQRQRISIARALVGKPPIFIFDEATSAVDSETEALIQLSLTKIAQNHTVCIIAHRLSTVCNADTIFVFNGGKIVEMGTHESLRKAGGFYDCLWSKQMGNMI